MPTPTPAVIEKGVVDIDFTKGLNEAIRAEHLPWQSWLKVSDNVTFEYPGQIVPRRGYEVLATQDTSSSTIGPISRLCHTSDGLAMIGKDFNLYQYGLGDGLVVKKGSAPEYSVTQMVGASWPVQADVTEADALGCVANSMYRAVLFRAGTTCILTIADAESDSVVRNYSIPFPQGGGGTASMCLVDDRYIHVYVGDFAGVGQARMYQFDTQSLTASGVLPSPVTISNPHWITTCVAIPGGSVVLMYSGGMARCTTAPAQAVAVSIDPADKHTGLDTDGTNLYEASITFGGVKTLKVITPATLAVTKTISDTAVDVTNGDCLRVAVGTGGLCYLVNYHESTGFSSTVQIERCATATDVVFTRLQDMPLWSEVCHPFYHPTTGRFYVGLKKVVAAYDVDVISSYSIDDVSNGAVVIQLDSNYTNPGGPICFRAAAAVGGYQDIPYSSFGYGGAAAAPGPKAFISGTNVHILTAEKSTFGSVSFIHNTLKAYDPSHLTSDAGAFSGGMVSSCDGIALQEYGFVDCPSIKVDANAGGSTIAAGNYSYTAIYEYRDCLGQSHFSRTARIIQCAIPANGTNTVNVTIPTVTNHHPFHLNAPSSISGIVVRLYRTVSGGTQYFLHSSQRLSTASPTTTTITFTDTMTDAQLEDNPLLYRQPGTQATPLDRRHALAGSCLVRLKDRVVYAHNSDVYYSSFWVDGEAPWFHPAFKIQVTDGQGRITGLCTMDGILVIFKANNIFVVDGDGPPENGGSGTEFSPPRRLAVEVGCVDPRTIVQTNNGIMFRSARGIELLTRNFQLAPFIGERVQETVDSNPYNGGATFDRTSTRAIFPVGDSVDQYGKLSTSGQGKLVVYETSTDTWSTYTYDHPSSGLTYGAPWQDVSFFNGMVYLANTRFGAEQDARLDVTAPVKVTLETGYVKAQSKQERIIVSGFLTVGRQVAPTALRVLYATDYSENYSLIRSWDQTTLVGLPIVQVEAQPPNELVQSMSFRLETYDAGGMAGGSRLDIFGLSVRVGLKGGGAKLAAEFKG